MKIRLDNKDIWYSINPLDGTFKVLNLPEKITSHSTDGEHVFLVTHKENPDNKDYIEHLKSVESGMSWMQVWYNDKGTDDIYCKPEKLNVYGVRKKIGAELAKESHVDADLVVAVPDSGTPAAIGYANQINLPFELGIIRNHYIGRTFIEPTQKISHLGV